MPHWLASLAIGSLCGSLLESSGGWSESRSVPKIHSHLTKDREWESQEPPITGILVTKLMGRFPACLFFMMSAALWGCLRQTERGERGGSILLSRKDISNPLEVRAYLYVLTL